MHKVIERIVIIRTFPNGDTLELNRIQWTPNSEVVFDLRRWSPEGIPKGSGYRLSRKQMSSLKRALNIRREI